MSLTSRALISLVAGLALIQPAQAEPTNFRVGTGLFQTSFDNAAAWMPESSDQGFTLFAEFPQSAHAGSRFMLYRINGEDGRRIEGGETQLMWGLGLDAPGLRLYTGPAWHYENIRVARASGSNTRRFNGWGWHAGTGFQYKAVTIDLTTTWRVADDYTSEAERDGKDGGDVFTYSLLASYRF
ncbi:porin family protein [Thalassolituus marinus]|uniref:Outer membrane protein beta-barrel domain-containing protein n=1 Tax=Thalassolituus marinus TaxID=671053 RepID=A0ABS7ZU88_9GAMM|nr:porin family protein [Thalassolituus marinus]MCA6065317.1 hypothetical protein [Thalassolituus marinus]